MFKVVLYRVIHSVAPAQEQIAAQRAAGLAWQIRSQGTYDLVGKPWCHARLETELPFAPFPGLRLEVGEMLYPLVKVEWRSNTGTGKQPYFFCVYEDWYPDGRGSYESLKKYHVDQRWQVAEFGAGER